MKRLALLFLLVFSLSFVAGAEEKVVTVTIPEVLKTASELMYAEKYEEALKEYESILAVEPDNKEALQGKADSELMLSPPMLVQALAPPAGFMGPEYEAAYKAYEDARTPWDKRRAEIAINRLAMRYTGEVFENDKERYTAEADRLISEAQQKIVEGANPNDVYLETRARLLEMQETLDRGWKGQGPQIFEDAINKLQSIYRYNGYQIPLSIVNFTVADTGKEPSKLGGLRRMSIKVENRFEEPVILIKVISDGPLDGSYSWQISEYGSVDHDSLKNEYVFNGLAQQATPPVFNGGIVFPGETAFAEFDVVVDQVKKKFTLGFAVLTGDIYDQIFLPADDRLMEVYAPADAKSIEDYRLSTKTPEGMSPQRKKIIFIQEPGDLQVQETYAVFPIEKRSFSREQAFAKLHIDPNAEYYYSNTLGGWILNKEKAYYLVHPDFVQELPDIDPGVFIYVDTTDNIRAELSKKAVAALGDVLNVEEKKDKYESGNFASIPKRQLLDVLKLIKEKELKVELVNYFFDSQRLLIKSADE
ncbi:MAG: hypothetical protein ABIJ26_05785 [Candidatus Margulisiibacteriota bacterium]